MFNLLKRCLATLLPTKTGKNLQRLETLKPAFALFNEAELLLQTPYGDTPLTLSEDVCVQYRFAAPAQPITHIKLRLGTYGRRNSCHLVVQLNETQTQIALADCLDNAYTEIRFTTPVLCAPQDSLLLRLFSPDAVLAKNNVVALWCSPPVPLFQNDITPTPLHFAPMQPPQFSVLCQADCDELQLYQTLRRLLESDPHADKEIWLYGASQPLPWLTGAVQYLDKPEQARPQGEFVLWLTQPALLSDGSLQALRESLLPQDAPHLVMPKVLDEQGRLRSAGGQVFADARFYQYPVAADATHPEYNQPRRVFCAQPPCVLMRQTTYETHAYTPYQSAAYALLHLSLSVQQVNYCPTACAVVADWQSVLPEVERQWCLRHWYKILQQQPQPLLPMPKTPRLHCPEDTKPLFSIIIPVFNQVDYSWHCLHSLLQCDTHLSREIIIIDNASSDRSDELFKGLSGAFKVIRQQQNLGFVEACNQGAATAQGRYLFLLNNDTQLRPNCLDAMRQQLDQHPEVGIVGAKLLYPDGRLQEAGCQIFADGSATNLGRAGDAFAAFAQQDRDVDYCSGAALLIRADLWRRLGGFDPRYAPAYYEDTDLCMQVRQAGFKVRYCHNAEVIHYEGVTAGVDVNSGYKAYQARNQQRFYAKWRVLLEAAKKL